MTESEPENIPEDKNDVVSFYIQCPHLESLYIEDCNIFKLLQYTMIPDITNDSIIAITQPTIISIAQDCTGLQELYIRKCFHINMLLSYQSLSIVLDWLYL